MQCWLGSEKDPLPDVYTTLPEVRATYSNWIQGLIANYSGTYASLQLAFVTVG